MSDEIILALMGIISSIGGTVVVHVFRRMNRTDTERRHELETTRLQRDQLLTRVADLEKETERLETVEAQLRVVYKMVEDLQTWKEQATHDINNKDKEIDRLRSCLSESEKQNAALFESSKAFKVENKTMRDMIALLGLRLAEDKPDPPTPPGPTAPDSAPNEFSKLPKAA